MSLLICGNQLVNLRFQKTGSTDAPRQAHPFECSLLGETVNDAHAASEAAGSFFSANDARSGVGRRNDLGL